jgi:2-polyprenyl-3-methyl-5-hydroxy-6-metoxy-1,4-benzoquinol methylase
MEEPHQARAYSEADFADAHDRVVSLLLERHPEAGSAGTVVDLGCGPADVTVRVARALPGARVVGLDAGARMLALGRDRVRESGLADRVELRSARLPAERSQHRALGRFDVVVSNSLLHHLADPMALWHTAAALAAPGAVVHVVDLLRPSDDEAVEVIVARETGGAPEVLVEDFRRSLRAAYRPDEVEGQLVEAGLDRRLVVEQVSDRHLLVHGTLP